MRTSLSRRLSQVTAIAALLRPGLALMKASSIVSPYQILADKALLQFAQTALGLSSYMSQADIDTQANMITKKLNIDDLQNPTKVNKLIAQFSALYDLNNSDVSTTSPILQILNGSSSSSHGIITIDPITTPISEVTRNSPMVTPSPCASNTRSNGVKSVYRISSPAR